MGEERNAAIPITPRNGPDERDERDEAEDTLDAEETHEISLRSRARTWRSAPNIVHSMGRLLGP